jgi:hypothetical protein
VFDDPALTRDVQGEGADAMHGGGPVPPDASIEATFSPGSGRALVTLIAGPEPDRLRLVSSVLPGEPRVQPVTVGQPRKGRRRVARGPSVRDAWHEIPGQ